MCTKATDVQGYFYQHYVKQKSGNDAQNSYGRNIHPATDKNKAKNKEHTMHLISVIKTILDLLQNETH